jgi:hypothetical protein
LLTVRHQEARKTQIDREKNLDKEKEVMKKYVLKIVFVILFLVCRLQADTTWTTGYHEINDGDIYGEIWMYNDCTLNIFGGTISRVAAYDTTFTNWYGGQMYELWAKENSIVNIYGGQLSSPNGNPGFAWFADQSIVNLYAYNVTYTSTGGVYGGGLVTGRYYFDNSSFIFDLYASETYSHVNIVPEPATFLLLALSGMFLRKK